MIRKDERNKLQTLIHLDGFNAWANYSKWKILTAVHPSLSWSWTRTSFVVLQPLLRITIT